MIRSSPSIAASIPMATASYLSQHRKERRERTGQLQNRALLLHPPFPYLPFPLPPPSSTPAPLPPIHPRPPLSPPTPPPPKRSEEERGRKEGTNLTDSQMTEASNLLCLVQGIGSHLHSPHPDHVGVHLDQKVLGNLNVRRRSIASEPVEPANETKAREGRKGGRRGERIGEKVSSRALLL